MRPVLSMLFHIREETATHIIYRETLPKEHQKSKWILGGLIVFFLLLPLPTLGKIIAELLSISIMLYLLQDDFKIGIEFNRAVRNGKRVKISSDAYNKGKIFEIEK